MSNIGSKSSDSGEECLNILRFANDLISAIQAVDKENNMGISMRIGVHTGDIIAGITGKSIVRYDIYGNDNYIANAMESNGTPGKIAVSQVTMNLVKNYRPSLMEFESYKTVDLFETSIQMYLARFK